MPVWQIAHAPEVENSSPLSIGSGKPGWRTSVVSSCVGVTTAVAVGGGVFAGRRGTVTVGGGSVALGAVPHAPRKNTVARVKIKCRFKMASRERSSIEYMS